MKQNIKNIVQMTLVQLLTGENMFQTLQGNTLFEIETLKYMRAQEKKIFVSLGFDLLLSHGSSLNLIFL